MAKLTQSGGILFFRSWSIMAWKGEATYDMSELGGYFNNQRTYAYTSNIEKNGLGHFCRGHLVVNDFRRRNQMGIMYEWAKNE